jgi:uncharacterized protein (TIGR03437 family)
MRRSVWTVSALGVLLHWTAWSQIGNIVVTSGASFQPGIPPALSVGTIFCTGVTVTGVVAAASTPLQTVLAGVTVTVGGVAAPLFAVADVGGYQQINFQVPVYTGAAQVVVSQNGSQGSATATNDPDAPGDFFQIGGTQLGVFQHGSDYSLVTPSNPAKAGETIVAYATGLPTAVPAPPAGQPAPLSPLSYVPQMNFSTYLNEIGLSLNGKNISGGCIAVNGSCNLGSALFDPTGSDCYGCDTTGLSPVPFMGFAPGMVGVYQVNFVMPQGLSTGNVPIQFVRAICNSVFASGCDGPTAIHYWGGQAVLLPVG